MKTRTSALCLVALLIISLPVLAQDESAGPSVREQVETELEVFRTELGLSEYTWTQVELILKSGIRERVAIARRYGLNLDAEERPELSGKDKRHLSKELKESRKGTSERMERYLDKDQMKEFKQFQETQVENMRQRAEAIQQED